MPKTTGTMPYVYGLKYHIYSRFVKGAHDDGVSFGHQVSPRIKFLLPRFATLAGGLTTTSATFGNPTRPTGFSHAERLRFFPQQGQHFFIL